jgi:hypothetical protein
MASLNTPPTRLGEASAHPDDGRGGERNEENAPPAVRIFFAFRAAAASSRVTAMRGRLACSLAVLGGSILAAGCSGQATTPASPLLIFPGAPALTVASASGQLSIDLWWSPAQPTVGYDATQLAVTDAAGAPVAGLTLTVVPFMPAHGHGASVEPTVSETAPGVYVATPLDFFMAGNWELMTAIARTPDGGRGGDGGADASGAGSLDDSADPTVEVP